VNQRAWAHVVYGLGFRVETLGSCCAPCEQAKDDGRARGPQEHDDGRVQHAQATAGSHAPAAAATTTTTTTTTLCSPAAAAAAAAPPWVNARRHGRRLDKAGERQHRGRARKQHGAAEDADAAPQRYVGRPGVPVQVCTDNSRPDDVCDGVNKNQLLGREERQRLYLFFLGATG